MIISQTHISELREIFLEDFGLELSESETSMIGESLIKVFETLNKITIKQHTHETEAE